jgi:uncharacterized protein YaaW (UPF0174 family)
MKAPACLPLHKKLFTEKILQVTVDETGTISVGRDTVGSDNLARYIQERLFKSYMGTGLMHSKIKFSKVNDNVPEIVIRVVLEEIQQGQKRALTELCLAKYKNLFDNIDKRKQDKLRKQFPVLFQTDYL